MTGCMTVYGSEQQSLGLSVDAGLRYFYMMHKGTIRQAHLLLWGITFSDSMDLDVVRLAAEN